MAKMAKSAVLPTSSVPWLAERPSAVAAERVTPASASSGVRRKSVAAMFSISSSDVAGELPGLQSLEIAMGTPALRIAAMGGSCFSRRK